MAYKDMRPGTQVMMIPDHADHDPTHPSVEYGFVVEDLGRDCYVRYWRDRESNKLRTKANSERTPKSNLMRHNCKPQYVIDMMISAIQREKLKQ